MCTKEHSGILPLVLCGGYGERLRGALNTRIPKQFLKLAGDDDLSMLQQTIRRVRTKDELFCAPVLFGQEAHADKIMHNVLSPCSISNLFLEPERKNTAAPVILGALYALKAGLSHMLVLPSDHVIHDVDAFHLDVCKAHEVMKQNKDTAISYFGIYPDRAFEQYGYILGGNKIKFYEKPNSKVAAQLIRDGALWNSGVFLISVQFFLQDLADIDSDLLEICRNLMCNVDISTNSPVYFDSYKFAKLPNISFDNVYCEKTNKGLLMRATFDWRDIGSIEMLDEVRATL